MNPVRPISSSPSSTSGKTTRNPPTKRAALVGGVGGTCIGLSSHFLLLDYLIVTITIILLYFTGITLMIDYMYILQQAPHDGGTWWGIAFGATTGIVLMVMQQVYRPTAPDEIAVGRDHNLPEEVALVPMELIIVSWLLMFGVALVSLTYGIAMAVTDMSEC